MTKIYKINKSNKPTKNKIRKNERKKERKKERKYSNLINIKMPKSVLARL